MKQSFLCSKTLRNAPKDEVAVNAQLLIRAGFIDKLMAGAYTYLPLGLRVIEKIETIVREEMNAVDGQELLMPAMHPKENWVQTGRWDSMDDLYKVKDRSDRETALGATHEEIVVPLAKRFIESYKDLPLSVYQIQNKFRQELRSKSGILRGREFLMKDMYSFHADEADLNAYYARVQTAYENVFNRVGIGAKTYKSFASGGSFSKFSHEYQTVTSAGEDIIYICDKCRVAVNREVIEEQKTCPECGAENLREDKAIEVGNIFQLKTKYTEPFKLTFKDGEGKENLVTMGCYGIGISRLVGAVVEVSHDEKGIIWPEAIAPFKVHLIEIGDGLGAEAYQKLSEAGVEALYDDRDVGAGAKFADADLIGLPYRMVIGKKTDGKFEVKKRDSDEQKLMTFAEILELCR